MVSRTSNYWVIMAEPFLFSLQMTSLLLLLRMVIYFHFQTVLASVSIWESCLVFPLQNRFLTLQVTVLVILFLFVLSNKVGIKSINSLLFLLWLQKAVIQLLS